MCLQQYITHTHKLSVVAVFVAMSTPKVAQDNVFELKIRNYKITCAKCDGAQTLYEVHSFLRECVDQHTPLRNYTIGALCEFVMDRVAGPVCGRSRFFSLADLMRASDMLACHQMVSKRKSHSILEAIREAT